MDIVDKVSTTNPIYDAQQPKRNDYRDVFGGTDAMRKAGAKHLQPFNAEPAGGHAARLRRATIDGLVMGGVDTLAGTAFEGEIDISGVNASIKPLLENVDNKGNSFNIFARDAFKESFDGFSCVLVDMPNAKANDAEQERALGLRPYLNLYCASNVINWRHRVNPVSKKQELALLVLKEVSGEPAGRFGLKNVTRYRALFCEGGIVTWELWEEQDKVGSKDKDLVMIGAGTIEKVLGIPAAFIGDLAADPKLLVETRLEIKAYEKESSFDVVEYLQGAPTFCTKGYEGEEELVVGANAHLKLPIDGDAFYMQLDAAGHAELKATIQGIKDEIKSRVNTEISKAVQAAEKTATEVSSNDKSKQARLIVWTDELKDALETALMYMGQFMGLGDDKGGEIVLKTKWAVAAEQAAEQKTRDAEMHQATVAKTMAGAAPAK